MKNLLIFYILILSIPLMGQEASQKKANKSAYQKEPSSEFINYTEKMNSLKNTKWENISYNEKKSLASQFFLATTKNPLEVTNLIMEKPELRLGWPGRIFGSLHDNRRNNLLNAVYVASLIFVGQVTSIEIMKKDKLFDQETVLFKYGFKIKENLNPISSFTKGENISFYFPTGKRPAYINSEELKQSKLIEGNYYLIFLTTLLLDYDLDNGDKLPDLAILDWNNEGWEVNNNAIEDSGHFFSEKNNISIEEVQSILSKTINDLKELEKVDFNK